MITTEFIFMTATIVFLLMVIGIILTMREFEKLEAAEQRENASSANAAEHLTEVHKAPS